MNRRDFMATGLCAASGVFPFAALAHDADIKEYELPEEYLPREVRINNGFAPGEIHVDPGQFALYWTLEDDKAIRYTVGIGRPGLYEAGEFYVGAKKKWPSWTPTPDMIGREPEKYAQFADGVPGGINNPLGARALYLFTPGRGDTYLRIHGTNNPRTIGKRVSNGCARLVNSQLVELYERVPLNTRVVLHPAD
tara:strand:+ start:237 stop:818 length:582 start_codon:yes stop_codon:yes gene_type:complete